MVSQIADLIQVQSTLNTASNRAHADLKTSVPRLISMAKHTQAHLPQTVDPNQSDFMKQRTKKQMEYYMGAKLLEIGVDPKIAIYRWKTEPKGNRELWTYSAYWGDSKDRILQEEQAAANEDS